MNMRSTIISDATRSSGSQAGRFFKRHPAALFLTAISMGTASPALASDQTGNITSIAMTAGRVFFWMSGARTGTKPSCDCCSRWEIVVNDANSQAKMAIILTAYAQGKAISVAGTGACVGGANDTEGVNYFQTQ
jgi:hypothetical protein